MKLADLVDGMLLTGREVQTANKAAWKLMYPEKRYPSSDYPPDGAVDWRRPIEEEVYECQTAMLRMQVRKVLRVLSSSLPERRRRDTRITDLE